MSQKGRREQGRMPDARQDLMMLPGLQLMRMRWAMGLVAGSAVVLLAGIIAAGWVLFGIQGLKPETQVSATTLFDLLKIAFAVVAGLGGLVALVVAYRRQKVTEAAQQLAEATHVLAQQGELREATKLHNDRFATAAGQLGHDSPAVRLAGVHALAGLADDAPTRELRQTCIDVLCAYLRLPYAPEPAEAASEADKLAFAALREVRHTIIRLIAAHLDENVPVSWQGYDLDFTRVVFDGGDFSHAHFSGGRVLFDSAVFSSGTVYFTDVLFESPGGVFFHDAVFSGGTVAFARAVFYSLVFFEDATFSGGTVSFNDAIFEGGKVSFERATFSDGTLSFSDASFYGGAVSFKDATFSGGMVDLAHPGPWKVPPEGLPSSAPPGLLLPPQESQTDNRPPASSLDDGLEGAKENAPAPT